MGNIEVIKTPIHQQFKAWSEQLGSVYRFRILDRMMRRSCEHMHMQNYMISFWFAFGRQISGSFLFVCMQPEFRRAMRLKVEAPALHLIKRNQCGLCLLQVVVLTDPETSKYLKPGPTYMPKAWRVYQGFRKVIGTRQAGSQPAALPRAIIWAPFSCSLQTIQGPCCSLHTTRPAGVPRPELLSAANCPPIIAMWNACIAVQPLPHCYAPAKCGMCTALCVCFHV
eukprot:1147128-Pelagomonas_calceolata.AAC.3